MVFYHRVHKFVELFYVDILGASDYWYRFEWQHRGSPHIHGVAWLCNAPNVEHALQDDDASSKHRLFDFIDSLVCTHNPGILPDGSNLDNAPSESIDPHVCSRPYSQIEDHNTDLIKLVANCQRHTQCSTSYCLQTKHGKQECRFGYPKPMQEQTTIVNEDGECELFTAQNDTLVNSYNQIQLSAWRANVDMKYLVSKEKVVEYCAKYATKSEPHSQSLRETFQIVVNCLKEGSYSVTAVLDYYVYITQVHLHSMIYMTLLTFARSYIMPKQLSAEPTHRRKFVIVSVWPYCSPDPMGQIMSSTVNKN